jgi:hypothetical protein
VPWRTGDSGRNLWSTLHWCGCCVVVGLKQGQKKSHSHSQSHFAAAEAKLSSPLPQTLYQTLETERRKEGRKQKTVSRSICRNELRSPRQELERSLLSFVPQRDNEERQQRMLGYLSCHECESTEQSMGKVSIIIIIGIIWHCSGTESLQIIPSFKSPTASEAGWRRATSPSPEVRRESVTLSARRNAVAITLNCKQLSLD